MYSVCFLCGSGKKLYVKKHDDSFNKFFPWIGVLQPSEKSSERGGKYAAFIFLKNITDC